MLPFSRDQTELKTLPVHLCLFAFPFAVCQQPKPMMRDYNIFACRFFLLRLNLISVFKLNKFSKNIFNIIRNNKLSL